MSENPTSKTTTKGKIFGCRVEILDHHRGTYKVEITNTGKPDWVSRFMMSEEYFDNIFGGKLTEETP